MASGGRTGTWHMAAGSTREDWNGGFTEDAGDRLSALRPALATWFRVFLHTDETTQSNDRQV